MTITGNGGKSQIGSIITAVRLSNPTCPKCKRNIVVFLREGKKFLCPHCRKEIK
jgi:predicted RNA-binding Zn-ribbon protein involved in translation (DUF1610 family)